jgi:hypothetical protein
LLGLSAPAAEIREVEPWQIAGQTDITFYLRNNDNGVTYDSAELKLRELLLPVAETIRLRNDDYKTNTVMKLLPSGVGDSTPPLEMCVRDGTSR